MTQDHRRVVEAKEQEITMSGKSKHPTQTETQPSRRHFVKQVTVGAVGFTAGQMLPGSVGAAKNEIETGKSSLQYGLLIDGRWIAVVKNKSKKTNGQQ